MLNKLWLALVLVLGERETRDSAGSDIKLEGQSLFWCALFGMIPGVWSSISQENINDKNNSVTTQ